MKRFTHVLMSMTVALSLAAGGALAADNSKALLGTWTGKASGPDGAPPSGDIEVTFVRKGAGDLEGKIVVKAAGGVQYSGQISNVTFEKKVVSATVTFKLGENPTEVSVTGPLKGKTIEGTFAVLAKGEKIGEGTFSITKAPAAAQK